MVCYQHIEFSAEELSALKTKAEIDAEAEITEDNFWDCHGRGTVIRGA